MKLCLRKEDTQDVAHYAVAQKSRNVVIKPPADCRPCSQRSVLLGGIWAKGAPRPCARCAGTNKASTGGLHVPTPPVVVGEVC